MSRRVTRASTEATRVRTSEEQWRHAAAAPRVAQPSACLCERLLADALLLLVLEHLSPLDLLAARGVCARWRRVASTRALYAALNFAAEPGRVTQRTLSALLRLAGASLRTLDLDAPSCESLSGRKLLAALEDGKEAAAALTELVFRPDLAGGLESSENLWIHRARFLLADELTRLSELCANLNGGTLCVGIWDGRDARRLRLPQSEVQLKLNLLGFRVTDAVAHALADELVRAGKEAYERAALLPEGERRCLGPSALLAVYSCSMSDEAQRTLTLEALFCPSVVHSFIFCATGDTWSHVGMATLAETLGDQGCSLEMLFVQNYHFCDDAWEDFGQALANASPVFCYLYITHCALDAAGAAALAAALRANATLRLLSFSVVETSTAPLRLPSCLPSCAQTRAWNWRRWLTTKSEMNAPDAAHTQAESPRCNEI